ncbi:MAG: hypothetical protein JWM27_3464 [Gemmatimonadetes bacterium]|nr:hypothetical protein [Gemmatimonadota bacterium]
MTKMSLAAAAAALAAFAGSARAQACNGFPTVPRQYSVAAVANFPSGYTQYGAEASYHGAGPGAINGGFLHESPGGVSLDHFRIGASYDLSPLNAGMGVPVGICPTASLDFASNRGVDLLVAPVGVGFGVSLPLGADPRSSVQPYVVPALVFDRVSDGTVSDTRTSFGLRGGVSVTFGSFFVTGEVNQVFDAGSNAVFGVKAGFRAR